MGSDQGGHRKPRYSPRIGSHHGLARKIDRRLRVRSQHHRHRPFQTPMGRPPPQPSHSGGGRRGCSPDAPLSRRRHLPHVPPPRLHPKTPRPQVSSDRAGEEEADQFRNRRRVVAPVVDGGLVGFDMCFEHYRRCGKVYCDGDVVEGYRNADQRSPRS